LSKGFVVSGSSAGGNLAAVVAHQAVDEALEPPVTGVALMAPVLVHSDAVPEEWRAHYKSYEEHKDAPILDRRGIEWFAGMCPCHLSLQYLD
jgi:acetyl esterase/lipase